MAERLWSLEDFRELRDEVKKLILKCKRMKPMLPREEALVTVMLDIILDSLRRAYQQADLMVSSKWEEYEEMELIRQRVIKTITTGPGSQEVANGVREVKVYRDDPHSPVPYRRTKTLGLVVARKDQRPFKPGLVKKGYHLDWSTWRQRYCLLKQYQNQ